MFKLVRMVEGSAALHRTGNGAGFRISKSSLGDAWLQIIIPERVKVISKVQKVCSDPPTPQGQPSLPELLLISTLSNFGLCTI